MTAWSNMGVTWIKPLPVIGQPIAQIEDRLRIHPAFILAGYDISEWVSGHGDLNLLEF
jgi:hypothetical protein